MDSIEIIRFQKTFKSGRELEFLGKVKFVKYLLRLTFILTALAI